MDFYHNRIDIPSEFYNEDSKQPFDTCISCSENLEDKKYFIEKAFKKDPFENKHHVIFEYALCEGCAQKKNNELSAESKANIEAYFGDHFPKQSLDLFDEDLNIKHCMLSQLPLDESDEYVIYGYFEGGEMLKGVFPYGLSGKILDEIIGLLSAKSLGEIDDFIGENFGGPPEFKELLKDKKWAVV